MTIAIAVRVNDGVVLAADSASTLESDEIPGAARTLPTIYNNANKILNLRKGTPIGAAVWGQGSIGFSSMATVLKDLRRLFATAPDAESEWWFDPNNYRLSDIANLVRRYLVEQRIPAAIADSIELTNSIGVLVTGYSSLGELAEAYAIEISVNGACESAQPVSPGQHQSISYHGQQEAIHRLILGVGTEIVDGLQLALQDVDEDTATQISGSLTTHLRKSMVRPYMPIQDAIDLAEFLADASAKFIRFTQGAHVVGGPIEIAAITKHEGFKWIRRKLYYDRSLNPVDGF